MPRAPFLSLLLLTPLMGCEADLIPYALEQGLRQGAIILRAEKIDRVLSRSGLDEKTIRLLKLTKEILHFAEHELGMKTGKSYRSYLDLKKPYLTQVVMAAYPDRLEPYLFKFPVVGEVPYKGYFEEKDAIRLEKKLQAEGLDTYRREVDAFSSLGWFADPILSTMLESEWQLTELLFHELTHLNFYFSGESDFNEAFATYLGRQAALLMIEKKPDVFADPVKSKAELLRGKTREEILGRKIKEALKYGAKFYEQKPPPERKVFFEWLRQHFSGVGDSSKLKNLEWNNALLLSLSTYYDLVPSIETYAEKNGLALRDYLKWVVNEGAGVIPKILQPSPLP